jgi:hypothetical protein
MIDKQKESEFYKKSFKFSYSSLNKLLFSPTLFYKDYILLDRDFYLNQITWRINLKYFQKKHHQIMLEKYYINYLM